MCTDSQAYCRAAENRADGLYPKTAATVRRIISELQICEEHKHKAWQAVDIIAEELGEKTKPCPTCKRPV